MSATLRISVSAPPTAGLGRHHDRDHFLLGLGQVRRPAHELVEVVPPADKVPRRDRQQPRDVGDEADRLGDRPDFGGDLLGQLIGRGRGKPGDPWRRWGGISLDGMGRPSW
jgi:hypothetical protein